MFCNSCGQELTAGSRYCPQCGRGVPGANPAARRRIPLERPRQGRKIAGVCLALANNFNVDVTLVRVLWTVLTVLGAVAFGVLAYLVAWVLIPEEPLPAEEVSRQPSAV